MDTQTIVNAALGIVAFLGGWVLDSVTKAIQRLDSEARNLPHVYVTKDEYRRDIDEIKSICQQIFDRLDGKLDK